MVGIYMFLNIYFVLHSSRKDGRLRTSSSDSLANVSRLDVSKQQVNNSTRRGAVA